MLNKMISAVVLNYNDYNTTMDFINRIKNYSILNHIIVVDNCSTDDSFNILRKLANNKIVVIKSNRNGGYGYGNNFGIEYIRKNFNSKYIMISNPDVEMDENIILKSIDFLKIKKDAAIVAPLMREADKKINYRCVWKLPHYKEYLFFSAPIMGRYKQGMYYEKDFFFPENKDFVKEVGCVAGSLLFVDAEAIYKCGMYDENIFLYCEETVLGLKMNKTGYKTYVMLNNSFLHKHSVSINKSITSKNKQNRLLWTSRLYVLYHYFELNLLQKLFCKVVSLIVLFETAILNFLSKYKGR